MRALLSIVLLVAIGWGVWSYVLRPAVMATQTVPTATAGPVRLRATPSPSATPQGAAHASLTVAQTFLGAWAQGRYDDMYDLLSPGARAAISGSDFVARYRSIAKEATITQVQPLVVAHAMQPTRAVVTYTVTMSTTAVGTLLYTDTMPLHNEDGRWSVGWSPDLIFPGLGTAYRVHLYHQTAQRGMIVDRRGQALAVQGKLLQVGIVPQYIRNEPALLSYLSTWLHIPATTIQAMYHVPWAVQNPVDLVPITDVTSLQWNAVPPAQQQWLGDRGVEVNADASRRLYPYGTLAAQLIGYVNSQGHGSTGLEAWADPYLSGSDGATLAIANAADYSYIFKRLGVRPKHDGATVHLTIDATLQAAAQKALVGRTGAVVAIRPSDGAVLALASAPGYDPNGFVSGLTTAQYQALLDSPHQPLFDHATEGQYPLGSVFKLVTAGAALEKAGFTPDTTRFCAGVWTGLGAAYAKHDWLPQGHGTISLHEAIVQSCDIYFYQVGLQLNTTDPYLLPSYARHWGLGAPTGITGVSEGAGVIPDPTWAKTHGRVWVPGNAVDMAIGQGDVLVTPLQVARMMAAIADGGVLHRPYILSRITGADSSVISATQPLTTGTLPISSAHLQAIVDAMHGVTTEAYGTAADKFAGFTWSVAGKTGTAQAGTGNPHAWFAAFAPVDHPRIALVVMVEHGGEGSAVAAPVARQILQTFFTQVGDLAGTTAPDGSHVLPVQ